MSTARENGAGGKHNHLDYATAMFSTRSHPVIRLLAAFGLVAPASAAVAQGRPLSIVGGVGIASVSGSLAGSARTAWTLGLGAERRVASVVALGADIVYDERGGTLTSDTFTSKTTISFSTIGFAPTARFHLGGRRSSFAPVVSSGILLWKNAGCSVDYDSDFDSGRITEPCGDYAAGEAGTGPLEKLGDASGATLLLGLGVSNARIGFELRMEKRLGSGARTPNGEFAFGNTLSVIARFHPAL